MFIRPYSRLGLIITMRASSDVRPNSNVRSLRRARALPLHVESPPFFFRVDLIVGHGRRLSELSTRIGGLALLQLAPPARQVLVLLRLLADSRKGLRLRIEPHCKRLRRVFSRGRRPMEEGHDAFHSKTGSGSLPETASTGTMTADMAVMIKMSTDHLDQREAGRWTRLSCD